MSYNEKILPELVSILNNNIKFDLNKDLEKMRNIEPQTIDFLENVKISTDLIKGLDSNLLVKIYEPKNRSQRKLPCVFWIHGGGYVLGHPDGDDGLCQCFVDQIDCVVVSVDYRLAPEHPYPAAITDCYKALEWTWNNCEKLNIDSSRIAVAGASAGGGLAAAIALMARDRREIKLSFQMPLYPMIDDRNETFSSYEINEKNMPLVWNRESNLIAWKMYLGENYSKEVDYYAAPARAKDLSGLPPTYICVGQLDPFRDETIDYVQRLAKAGVPVEFHLYPGCFHGFDSIFNKCEISKQARNEYIDALGRALNLT